MTPETLEYLEAMLTENLVAYVEELEPALGSSESYGGSSELFEEIRKTSIALKEVQRAIRRAENRAKRKARREE